MEAPSRTQARGSRDATPGCSSHHVLQQRRLADPRLATQDQHATLTSPHALQQSIEGPGLAAPPKEPWLMLTIRHGSDQGPCPGVATGQRVRGDADHEHRRRQESARAAPMARSAALRVQPQRLVVTSSPFARCVRTPSPMSAGISATPDAFSLAQLCDLLGRDPRDARYACT
jgi:hypothetical protein